MQTSISSTESTAPDPNILFTSALSYHQSGDYDRAFRLYSQVLEILPGFIAAKNNIGLILIKKGRLDEALLCYKEIIEVNPAIPMAYLNLGQIYQAIGQTEQSITCYKTAIELKNDYSEAYNNLGLAYSDTGMLIDSINSFKKLVTISPEYTIGHINLNIILKKLNNHESVIKCYKDIIKEKPDIADVHFYLGEALYDSGEYEKARKSYAEASKIDPDFGVDTLKRIRIETSSVCNLRCQHCPTGTSYGNIKRSIMDMGLFDSIINHMKKIPFLTESVLYLGGEPLLNKNLPTICSRVKNETHVKYTMFNTNGMLIDEKTAMALSGADIDQIGVSIDGRCPEENDMIRKGSSYKALVKNVGILRRHLPKTLISIDNTIIKRAGDPDLPQTPEFLQKDFPDMPIETTYAMKWPELNLKKSSIGDLKIEKPGQTGFRICKMPFNQLAVRSNGDVVFCCYDLLGKSKIGNILETDLTEIWRGAEYKKLRSNMLNFNFDDLPPICRHCPVYTEEKLII